MLPKLCFPLYQPKVKYDMKRTYLFLLAAIAISWDVAAQQTTFTAPQLVQSRDTTDAYLDSIFRELPEVMITGERPVVKASEGKLVYDIPRLISNLAVDNAYDAIKQLPGVVEMNDNLQLSGQSVTVIINGKVSTMSTEQLNALLKSTPASRMEKAEVMYAAPARYQVRGAVINLLLKSGTGDAPSLQGELYTAYSQNHYELLSERVSLLYSGNKFSADLLYSFNHGRNWMETDKAAVHTLSDGSVHPMALYDVSTSRSNRHNVRLGMDYTFAKDHSLSFVYTTGLSSGVTDGWVTGTQHSTTATDYSSQLHNARLDYQVPFGLKAGAEFTWFDTPSSQLLHSTLGEEQLDFLSKDHQQIAKWRFYLSQEHTLGSGWGVNYGAHYTTTTDDSYQYYYDPETNALLPDNHLKSNRREQTTNLYAGFNKSFGEKFSMDASLAAERYHTELWKEWSIYPTLNLNYTLSAGNILQLSLTSDKEYPEFWSMQNATSYMGAYSEIRGNPLLKPATNYETTLTYILKSKYMFSLFFSHTKDQEMQTLYQSPDRLVEIYKCFNFDFSQQVGVQASIPFKVKNWLDSRITAIGMHYRQKDSDFWDTSFDRRLYTFVLMMNSTFTLSQSPDLKFILSGFYQNRAIQGIYDLPRSGNLNAALRYTFAKERMQLILKCDDIFNTSAISPRIRFENQNVTNRYLQNNRTFVVSFSYKFGGYKEKKREAVDTSRFK